MKKLLLFLSIVLSFSTLTAQKTNVWKKVSQESVQQLEKIRATSYSERQSLYQLNAIQLKQSLLNASDKFSGQPGVTIEFPNIDGNLEKFIVWENSNFDSELQSQFPEIRAYIGKSISDEGSTINFSLSPIGIQTMILRPDNGTEFIEPYTKDNSVYVLFDSKTRNTSRLPFNCATIDQRLSQDLIENNPEFANRANNQSYKTMRLALSCTGEYGAYFGGTIPLALAGMNATMTRVNGIFEKDMALHLNIIANNNLVVYTNAGSDPYSPASGIDNWNAELQNTLTNIIGEANYDIGHLFGATGGGGNAGCIGCVCGTGKGSAYTSPSNNIPAGDFFDIDYVIHEMGHQLGANHTFSHQLEGSGVNVEIGGGTTIMGYAGITDFNVQNNSDAYFTYRSILQIQTNLATKTCPVSTVITNTPPVVNAGTDYTLPKGTAFILKGAATDIDNDVLSYCWEQNNNAVGAGATGANCVASPTKTIGPNYRSFTPTTSLNRFMPAYATVLTGSLSSMWESVSTVARSSKYSLTVRDNNITGQQTNTDEATYTTSATVGPFALTSQNTTGIAWAQGTSETITWSVNNTTTLPGSTNVNIKLSIDGGVTFPYILAADVPNDGSETITVPVTPASLNCRLWIEPTANVYYAVNAKVFYIGYQIVNNCTTYNFTTPFNLNDGSSSYTQKTINVPTAGIISDVNITINATHPNLQNLNIAVVRPGGSLASLYSQQCSGSADMNITFDSQGQALVCGSPTQGTYIPPTGFNLNTFNTFQQQGNWVFGFRDLVAGNAGTINSIALEVCAQSVIPLGIKDFDFENLAIYPNPNNGNFTVQFNSNTNNKINIVVYDLSGRTILDNHFNGSNLFSQNLQLSNAQSGIYLVSITDGAKKIVKKILVQ